MASRYDEVSRPGGIEVPVVLSADGLCIIWECKRPRTHRVYCRRHYNEMTGRTSNQLMPKVVKVKGYWAKAPNGRKYWQPPAERIRYVSVPKERELPNWKYREYPACATDDCDRNSKIRGLCRKCYNRAWRYAKSEPKRPIPTAPMEDRYAYTRTAK